MIIPYLRTIKVTLLKQREVMCNTTRSLIDSFNRIFEQVCHLFGVLYEVWAPRPSGRDLLSATETSVEFLYKSVYQFVTICQSSVSLIKIC